MKNIISVGDKVNMELLVNGQPIADETRRRVLTCKVMDLPETNLLRISMPFHEGRIVPLAVGDQYRLTIYSQKGIHGSTFVVINRLKEGNLFLADVELKGRLERVQRREFFRHDCRMTANYRMVTISELDGDDLPDIQESTQEDTDWKKCVILDISGGGVRMVSEYQETSGEMMQIHFPIVLDGQIEEVYQYGHVITSLQNPINPQLYIQRIQFEKIGEKERERIIRFIFDEERKRISKEKGLN